MSAYLVDPTCIGTLAQAIAARTQRQSNPGVIATQLAGENLRSVAHRYRTTNSGAATMFMGISAGRYIAQCRANALSDVNNPSEMSAAALQDIAGEYRYQSCECDDWPETKAAQLLKLVTERVAA